MIFSLLFTRTLPPSQRRHSSSKLTTLPFTFHISPMAALYNGESPPDNHTSKQSSFICGYCCDSLISNHLVGGYQRTAVCVCVGGGGGLVLCPHGAPVTTPRPLLMVIRAICVSWTIHLLPLISHLPVCLSLPTSNDLL